jgi:hypothetical protein
MLYTARIVAAGARWYEGLLWQNQGLLKPIIRCCLTTVRVEVHVLARCRSEMQVTRSPTVVYVDAYTPYGGRAQYLWLQIVAKVIEPVREALRPLITRILEHPHRRKFMNVVYVVVAVLVLRRVYLAVRSVLRRLNAKRHPSSFDNGQPTSPWDGEDGRITPRLRAKYGPVETHFEGLLHRFASDVVEDPPSDNRDEANRTGASP